MGDETVPLTFDAVKTKGGTSLPSLAIGGLIGEMKKLFLSLAVLATIATPSFAENFLSFVDDLPPAGTYERFPDKDDGFNLTIANDYFDIGRPVQCAPIKESVKIDKTHTVHFDAKCHGANVDSGSYIGHEKWHVTKAENGDVYLVTIDENAGNTEVEMWKLVK
jgi:hypothetical protein